jgi:hypothetical protein
MSLDVLPYVPIIALIVVIIFYVIDKIHRRNDNIKAVIIELIKIFVNPAKDKLKIDSILHKFQFPEILNYPFGLSNYDKFSKTKRIMGWRVKRYNKFCSQITKEVLELAMKTKEIGIIKYATDNGGYHPIITEKYEDLTKEEIESLLEKYKLNNYRNEINELLKELPEKSKKLCGKLEKLKNKWIRRYYLLQSDF